MQEADGTIFLFSTKHMGRKRKLSQRIWGRIWLLRSTRLELMKDGSQSFKSFVIFMMYQDPNFDVVLSDQRLRNGTVRMPLVNEECNG